MMMPSPRQSGDMVQSYVTRPWLMMIRSPASTLCSTESTKYRAEPLVHNASSRHCMRRGSRGNGIFAISSRMRISLSIWLPPHMRMAYSTVMSFKSGKVISVWFIMLI